MAFGRSIDMSALSRNAARLRKISATAGKRVVDRAKVTLRRRLATETRRYVAAEYGVSTRELGKRITTEAGSDSVSVYGTTPRVPLIKFGGRYTRSRKPGTGATAEIVRGQRKKYVSAFLSKGKKNIVARGLKPGSDKRYGRLPVVVLHGPSPESMVLGGGAPTTSRTPAERAAKLAEDIFSTEVSRLVDVELKG